MTKARNLAEIASSSLSVGAVTNNDVDLSTGNIFELTAANQTLSFSNCPTTHEFKLVVKGGGVTGGFVLDTMTYDNNSVDISGEELTSTGVALSEDGTRMFMCGSDNDTVFQYELTTGFDLSTASYGGVSFDVYANGANSNPQEIFFNTDGTKMFILGIGDLYQYTLTTGFDLSTCSFDNVAFDFGSQENNASGFTFSYDGSLLYLVGLTQDTVFQYGLTTPFDLSTISYSSKSFSIGSEQPTPYGIGISKDGKKIFVVGGVPREVMQWDLSTPFDVDTESYSNIEVSVNATAGAGPTSMHMDSLGLKMFITSNRNEGVYRYSMGTSTQVAKVNYPGSVTFIDDPAESAVDVVGTVSLYTLDGGTNYYSS